MSETTHDLAQRAAAAKERYGAQDDPVIEAVIDDLLAALVQAEQEKLRIEIAASEREDALLARLEPLDNALVQAEQREARIKELAKVEHTLVMTIVKRLQEIGQIDDHPDTNISGAIHGVINGYVSWKASAKAAEARLATQEATIAELKPVCDRTWEDETPEQIVAIAANALHWRTVEIKDLKDKRQAQEATIRQVEQSLREQEKDCREIWPNGTRNRAAVLNFANWLHKWADTLATLLPAESKKETENAPQADR